MLESDTAYTEQYVTKWYQNDADSVSDRGTFFGPTAPKILIAAVLYRCTPVHPGSDIIEKFLTNVSESGQLAVM